MSSIDQGLVKLGYMEPLRWNLFKHTATSQYIVIHILHDNLLLPLVILLLHDSYKYYL